MRGELTQLIAWSHLLGGDARAAGLALEAMPPGRDPEPALIGSIRLQSGDSAGAIEPLRAALGSGGKLVEQQLAEALVREQRFDEAVEAFGTAAARQVAPETLERLEEAAYRAQAFGAAAGIGELLFDREGRGIRAFNVACSLVRKGDEQGALSWLARARDAGLPEPTLLDDDEDLAPLRGRPEWPSLRASFDT
jgi:tetratricopeptide (TPR) repeat protein